MQAICGRYRHARRLEKRRMLDEFCAVTECYRKAAIRVLNSRPSGQGLNGAVASTTGPLAKSRLLQWSRGGAAAETYTSCDRIRLSSALQWSRGADAAETGRHHTARFHQYLQRRTRAVSP